MNSDLIILMAEDDAGHFALAQKYFAKMGVRNEMVWLQDGRQAVDYLFTNDGRVRSHPGKQFVLFLDIKMPHIDGWQVLERIKACPGLTGLPVVMLTAMESTEDIDKAMQLGCSAYIVKPVRYSNYIDAMKKVGIFPSVVAGGVELMSKCAV